MSHGQISQYSIKLLQTINQKKRTNRTMRKEISFQLSGLDTCLVTIRNIVGFSINYVEDKIKRHDGKWESKVRKFQVPLKQMNKLAKELQTIDRTFSIEPVPTPVLDLLTKHSSPESSGNRIRKQLLIDTNLARRHSYISETIFKSIRKNSSQGSGLTRMLLVSFESKLATWAEELQGLQVRRVRFQAGETDAVAKGDAIWLCSYEVLWAKIELLAKYSFQTIVVDEAEELAVKLAAQHQPALAFKKFLLSRHFVFPILSKFYLNKLDILLPLLPVLHPQTNFQWMAKRYRKQNLTQLHFLMKTCSLYRDLNGIKQSSPQHFFQKWRANLSQLANQKIKALNKKFSQIDPQRILNDPSQPRNKNERAYKDQLFQLLRLEKQSLINKTIVHLTQTLHLKLAIVIESNVVYRLIENFLCERQISYCHYEHHQEILDFNTNSNIAICLIKSQYLRDVNFGVPLCTKDQVMNAKLELHEPDQYLCLSGVRNVMFPDIDWLVDVRKKEQSIRQLFRHMHGDLVRHYILLRSSHEEKWLAKLQDSITKIQMNLKIKQDLMQEVQSEGESVDDPVFGFCELNLAKVQEEYSHLKVIKGVTDIDEEFDRLEYEALQQRLEREGKKKAKEEKAKRKFEERKIEQQMGKSEPIQLSDSGLNSQDEEFEDMLRKKKPYSQERPERAAIYKPIEPTEVHIEAKVISQSPVLSNQSSSQDLPKEPEVSKQLQPISQDFFDPIKDHETEQVQIIQVRKPAPKPKIPKPRCQSLKIILRPTLIS